MTAPSLPKAALRIRKAAVLGAGVMGAQIAAHLTNAGVETVLFDLPAKDGDPKSGIVPEGHRQSAEALAGPAGGQERAAAIIPANYDDDLEHLKDCDLVIEAIAERLDWKLDLYTKIAAHLSTHRGDRVSNTSGLSINALAEALPEETASSLQRRALLQSAALHAPGRADSLRRTTDSERARRPRGIPHHDARQGRGRSPRTPRTSSATASACFRCWRRCITRNNSSSASTSSMRSTGPAIGRPKSATYRTADVVGLDTMAHVIKTMADTLAERSVARVLQGAGCGCKALIAKGALGQKTGAGFYRKAGKDIVVIDVAKQDYRPSEQKASDEVAAILAIKDPGREVRASCAPSADPQAQFLWAIVPRPVPLQRLSPGRHRRHRARRRLRHPLGLRLEARSVRDLAGCRLAAGRRLDRRRHRRRQGHEQGAAAGMGHRRPHAACTARRVPGPSHRAATSRARSTRFTSASCSPIRSSARSSTQGTTVLENDGVAPVDPGRRWRRHHLVQDQDEYRQRLRARWRAAGHR